MAKTAQNSPGVVTVYDADGVPSVCALVDAKERVKTGRWSYAPPPAKEPEPPPAPVEEPEPSPPEEHDAPPEEVKQDEPRSGGRKRTVKR